MIFARISRSFKDLQSALQRIAEKSERFICYEHADNVKNVHVHFLAVGPSISTDTMKNYIKKNIGAVKSTEWSFKFAQDENCITYMSKGTLQPSISQGYEVSAIEAFRVLWKDPVGKQDKKTGDDKPSQYRIALEIHETLHNLRTTVGPQNQLEDYLGYIDNELHTYQEYCQLAIKLHHKYRVAFSFFSLDKVIHTAYTMRLEHRESFVAKLTEKFFPSR